MTDAAVDIRLVSKMSQLKEGAQGQGKAFFIYIKKMHYIICRAVFSCFTTKLQCSVPLQKHYLVFWPATVKSFNHALCFFFCHSVSSSLSAGLPRRF